MKMKNFNSSGFTLLELIVVFSVISILSTIGIAAFVSYDRTQIVEQSGAQLKATLNLARSRSLSQVKPSTCPSASVLDGYKVVVSLSNNSYDFNVICSGLTYPVDSSAVVTKKLPTNVTFDGAHTTSTSFFFPILTNGVQGTGAVVVQGYGRSATVTVDSTGGIK